MQFASFVPFTDTVIVLDYILGEEEQSARTVEALLAQFDASPYQLRLLFVERRQSNDAEDWLSKLYKQFSPTDRIQFEAYRYLDDASSADTAELMRINALTESEEQRLQEIMQSSAEAGSVAVGREVMTKAAAHLTPVTLELGGKSPCIVDETADLTVAARRIAFGKFLNCGQTCVAPDYVLVSQSVKEKFLSEISREIGRMYGPDPLQNSGYGKIINQKHFTRLVSLLDCGKVVAGGGCDPERLRIAPTVLDGVSPEDPVMQEEIFGPILPVLTVDSLDQAIAFVRARPRPLALYLFTSDRTAERRVFRELSFGGGCVNDTILHLASSRLPFGGVGNSGMGAYHGKRSFLTFSHEKGVLKTSTRLDMPLRYPPYTPQKERWSRRMLK